MTHNSRRHIILYLLLLLAVSAAAQVRSRLIPEALPQFFGSGGSNYSRRDPGTPSYDRNGLRINHYNGQHHLFGFWLEAAYNTYLTTQPNFSPKPGGMAFGGGITYEYQNNHFLLQTGAGLRYQQTANRIADTDFYDNTVTDAWGYPYSLHYEFYDRVDSTFNFSLNVPLLFGARFQGLYFLAGLKFNMHFNGGTFVRATGSTTGTYEQYLGLFEEMDNHGLRKDVPLERKSDMYIDLTPSILASLEIGYEWGKYAKEDNGFGSKRTALDFRFRLAVFSDITLFNIQHGKTKPSLLVPENYKWDFPAYQLNHALVSQDAKGHTAHNIFAGVKLTLLLGFKTKGKCVICSRKDLKLGL